MHVKEVMTHQVAPVPPQARLTETAQRMRAAGVDCLPVMQAERLVGMVTGHDIALGAVADGRDPAETMVAEVMTRGAPCCFDDQDVTDAIGIMAEKHVRRLVVVDHDDHTVGVLALGDLSRAGDCLPEADVIEAFAEYYGWSR